MRSAREAIRGGLEHIEEQILAIEQAMQEEPGFVFDFAKSLVESACKSILTERRIYYSRRDDLPKLLKKLTQQMPIMPSTESHATDVRRGLEKAINGLHLTIRGICELRNETGFSHGSVTQRPRLDLAQARIVAEAADSIVGFLYRVHTQDRTLPIKYNDNPDFNGWIDGTHDDFSVIDTIFKPSEVLFQMEPESYRVYLVDFRNQGEGLDATERDGDA